MKSKRYVLASMIVTSALALAACSSGSSDTDANAPSEGAAPASEAATAAADAWDISYSSPVAAQPGQQEIVQAMQDTATGLGWSAEFLDANLSADTQVSNVQTMIQQGKDAIAIWTLDPGAAAGVFKQAKDAGISLVGVNSPGDDITTNVVWSITQCGEGAPFQQAAAAIAEARPGAEVIVMGGPPVPSINAMVDCFISSAEAAGLKVLTRADNTKDSSSNASALASDLLTKYPDVQAFWAYNDASALGISAAIAQAGGQISDGTSEGIIVQGANGDPDAIEAIKQGRLTGTWDPDTAGTGVAIIKAMKLLADGTPAKEVVVNAQYFDKSNVDTWKPAKDRVYTMDSAPLTVNN